MPVKWTSSAGSQNIITLESVSKKFRLHHELGHLQQVSWFDRIRRREVFEDFWALKGITFSVTRGTTVGIIGSNGSGKSTLLKLITRVLEPTSGRITAEGRISALIELGAGFHPDLTGLENIYLNGTLLGMTHREVEQFVPQIISFAELERFIDTPFKFYSSGMQIRLGFAVATTVKPDILIADEVLAVGDEQFQRKCLSYMADYRRNGGTTLFVTHSLNQVRELCDRAIWLADGMIRADGSAAGVVDAYVQEVNRKEGGAESYFPPTAESEPPADSLVADTTPVVSAESSIK